MALHPSANFVGKINPPTPAFPWGSARNITTPDDGTGTPFIDLLINDQFGFFQTLLSQAGLTPSGTPDNVLNSQYMEALEILFLKGSNLESKIFETGNVKFQCFEDLGTNTALGATLEEDDLIYLHDNNLLTETMNYYTDRSGGGAKYRLLTTVEYTASVYNGRTKAAIKAGIYEYYWCLEESDTLDVSCVGVIYGTGVAGSIRIDNTTCLNDAFPLFDKWKVSGIVETDGKVLVRTGLTIEGDNRNNSQIRGKHLTEDTLTDTSFDNSPSLNNNTADLVIKHLGVNSDNANSLSGTFYQANITKCRFTANNGAGINLAGRGYQVENNIQDNYFTGCRYPILAPDGSWSPTDQYILDNYCFSNGQTENHFYFGISTGTTFRGNHFYGGSNKEMMHLVGGNNVSISDNYFESSTNARIKIVGGNPSSFTLTGNKFWQGDGTSTDYNGDQTSLITLSFNLFNPCKISMNGNIFEQGTNGLAIFNLLNGTSENLGDVEILFDKSNTINGNYTLGINGASGTGTCLSPIITDIHQFHRFTTTQSESLSTLAFSEYFQKSSGFAEGFFTLPTNTAWLKEKYIRINNISTDMTMTFNTGHVGGISGNDSTNENKILAGEIADLMRIDGNYYIKKLTKPATIGGNSVTYTFSGINLDFIPDSIPANGGQNEVSDLDVPLTGLTLLPTDVVNVCSNNMPAGVVQKVHYDNTLGGAWKVRNVNCTTTSASYSSALANISVTRALN